VPPRYAYWTILIDNRPTAFRARDQEELLPTLNQLKRTNPNAQMKWFARGKLLSISPAQFPCYYKKPLSIPPSISAAKFAHSSPINSLTRHFSRGLVAAARSI
jgi:hypothetical protein